MSFREAIEKSPSVTISVVVVMVVGAVALGIYNLRGDATGPQTQAYYSDDDGKTCFVDRVDKVVPFDHGGKQAVMAKMFTCDGGKTKFVGYLLRYTSDVQKRLLVSQAAVAAGGKPTLGIASMEVITSGTEVKRPGDPKWINSSDMLAKRKITDNIPCPAGGVLDSVIP